MVARPPVTEPISETRKLTWMAIYKGLEMKGNFIAGGQDEDVDLRREVRVPMFWADSTKIGACIADIVLCEVGVLFGVIHCLAWHFSFPTHMELLLWRISSVTTTVTIIYIPCAYMIRYIVEAGSREFGADDIPINTVFILNSLCWRNLYYSSSDHFGFSFYIS